MTTQTVPFYTKVKMHSNTPATARGRAIYTIAWFMHGSIPAVNYDNRHFTVHDIAKAAG